MATKKPVSENEGEITSLQGYLLVALPNLQDGIFGQSVIFMVQHDRNGAMGIILNHHIKEAKIQDILTTPPSNSSLKVPAIPLYFGGPVDPHRGFLLHSKGYTSESTFEVTSDIYLTSSQQLLEDIALGAAPSLDFKFVLGHAGWAPGQLEEEYKSGNWFQVHASQNLVFCTPNDALWESCFAQLGIHPCQIHGHQGNA